MQNVCSQFLPIKKVGSVYKCLCPFHDDKNTPSFTVYETSAYCFGCNQYWDAISFLIDYNQWTFPKAIQWLENNAYILPLAWEQNKPKEYVLNPVRMLVLEHWHNLALEREEVLRYYTEERLLTLNIIKDYMLGFDGERYIIPLWTGRPRESIVYNVKKRKANQEAWGPKYIALKNRPPCLFNKYRLENEEEVYIFFGEFDTLLAHQDGLAAVTGGSQNIWESSWNGYFSDAKKVWVVPDTGEEARGYDIASKFFGRSSVKFYPTGIRDYVDYRLKGFGVKDFLEL